MSANTISKTPILIPRAFSAIFSTLHKFIILRLHFIPYTKNILPIYYNII